LVDSSTSTFFIRIFASSQIGKLVRVRGFKFHEAP
jgi:hypothetical protein